MRFIKMHGIGNDYVYVNGFDPANAVDDPPALARRIADRHTGVGGDGLILVLPPTDAAKAQGAQVRMRMFNADGSEAEMCGNGVRCVCKLAYDHDVTPGIRDANPMKVETGNGVLTLDYATNGDGRVRDVTVDMGEPVLTPADIPVAMDGQTQVVDLDSEGLIDWPRAIDGDEHWREACGLDVRMSCVSMGNPHVTFFCQDVAKLPLNTLGPLVETHRLFPARVNVHFVQVHSPGEVTMRTWERGSGVTLACGTGASAVCVSGVLTGRTDRRVLAHLPGGDLTLQWREDDNHVSMQGPAEEVFTGEWS